MSNKDLELVKTGQSGSVQHFRIIPQGVASARAFNSISEEYGGDSSDVFDEDDGTVNVRPLTINGRGYQYVPFGVDDMLPHQLRKAVLGNMITAQCQQFNTICCYGQGLRFVDRKEKKDVDIPEITDFCLHNSLQECFAEQCTDMQMYNFSVTCIILSRDGSRIVNVRHKEACYCRFEYAPSTKSGKIEHVFFGDFRIGHFNEKRIEAIPLLDYWDARRP